MNAASLVRLREELVKKNQMCRREFHAQALGAIVAQRRRTIEMHLKIDGGIKELAKQWSEELM